MSLPGKCELKKLFLIFTHAKLKRFYPRVIDVPVASFSLLQMMVKNWHLLFISPSRYDLVKNISSALHVLCIHRV